MTYEELLEEAQDSNIRVIENVRFESQSDALIVNDIIGINKKIRSTRKKMCILAEELGHYQTTVGDIINQNSISNVKQEQQARAWAYDKLIGLKGIIDCYVSGCMSKHDMAEHLEVTEEFLIEALQ